jgi:hypothetical protein
VVALLDESIEERCDENLVIFDIMGADLIEACDSRESSDDECGSSRGVGGDTRRAWSLDAFGRELENMDHGAIRLVAVVSIIVAAVCLQPFESWSQEAATQPPADPGITADSRFEGYVFRDKDGRPLPFQTDEAIEHFLATAELVSVTRIPVGVTDPRKLLLESEGLRVNAVFKDIDDQQTKVRDGDKFYLQWRDWFGYDIAAYRLDRLLDLDRVPPVVARTVQNRPGSVQIWLQGVITDTIRRDEGYKPPDIGRYNQQKDIMHVFDNLVANRDSNLGNTLIDGNWRLWFIDCSRCFGSSPDLLYPDSITHCERDLFESLKALDPIEAESKLSPYLTGPEFKALFIRRDKIVHRIQELVDEYGEMAILFDVRPRTETAPWVKD